MTDTSNDFKGINLQRYPKTRDKSLRAWSAADEYLLAHLSDLQLPETTNILILNDQFGALTCHLSQYNLTVWTDSFLSKNAIKENLKANQLAKARSDKKAIRFVNQTTEILGAKDQFDLVIIRVPKHNSLLQFQLATIRSHLTIETKIIAAGMSKDIHKSTLKIFEQEIGATTTSLAKKKARLIFSEYKSEGKRPTNLPRSSYHLKAFDISVIGLPGVFSRDHLDIGAQVLLQYLPPTNGPQKLIDLGCGTGVLGCVAAKQNPKLIVTFCDESWLATESAKQTFQANRLNLPHSAEENSTKKDSADKEVMTELIQSTRNADFITTDCLQGLSDNSYDFVLCNPPFHQQNVQTLSIANKMFSQAAEKLNQSGELRVVANRHLKYRPLLSSYFSQVKLISNNPKFVVWLAKDPKQKASK